MRSLKYPVESFSCVSLLVTLIRYRKYPLCFSPGIHEVARLNVAILFAGRKGAILTGFHSVVWDRDEFGLDGADGFWVWQKSGLAISKNSNRLRFMGHLILPSDSHRLTAYHSSSNFSILSTAFFQLTCCSAVRPSRAEIAALGARCVFR